MLFRAVGLMLRPVSDGIMCSVRKNGILIRQGRLKKVVPTFHMGHSSPKTPADLLGLQDRTDD